MKLGRVLVLGIALVAGLIAAFLAMNLVNQPPPPAPVVVQQQAPEPVPLSKVLVAAVDIPRGTTISPDALEWRDWPPSGIADNYIVQTGDGAAQIAGIVHPSEMPGATTIANASFYAGEPIIDTKLVRSDQGYMAAILPAGMRAIATGISVVSSAGGFILPNDRVDVIMVRGGDTPGSQTEVILSNVRVLAIDQTIEDQGGQKVVVGQTATLELTPRQAQILAAAQPIGERLMLALRSIKDSNADPSDYDHDALYLIDGSKPEGVVTVVKGGVPRDVSGLR